MNIDSEINKVKSILRGRFDKPEDKRYWEDKLADLERRKYTMQENEKYFRNYEKGVPALTKARKKGWF